MFFPKRNRSAAACAAGVILCLSIAVDAREAHRATPASAASVISAASATAPNILSADSLPPHYNGDDPEHVRDALAAATSSRPQAPATNPSITSRVRNFLSHSLFKSGHAGTGAASGSRAAHAEAPQADRTFVFVIPASYGVRFESKKKLLSVNVSLAAPEQPDAILLKRKVEGQSGRKLVIAPEARSKGFIQTIDTIQLETGDRTKTTVRGRAMLTSFDPPHGNGDLAIVLVCSLEPPYLSDRVEHSDPTDEEPTDITRRTSTLHGRVDAVWVVDRSNGAIVTKHLRLAK